MSDVNSQALPHRRPLAGHGGVIPRTTPATERRVLTIDIPAGADDELAAMAAIVATVEALPAPGRLRVLEWVYERYVRAEPG